VGCSSPSEDGKKIVKIAGQIFMNRAGQRGTDAYDAAEVAAKNCDTLGLLERLGSHDLGAVPWLLNSPFFDPDHSISRSRTEHVPFCALTTHAKL
jgi:hypothetical protein